MLPLSAGASPHVSLHPVTSCTDPSGVCEPHEAAGAGVPTGYTYDWDNEFTGSSLPSNWTALTGSRGTVTCNTPAYATVSSGEFHQSTEYNANCQSGGFQSGNIESTNTPTYGAITYEARLMQDTSGGGGIAGDMEVAQTLPNSTGPYGVMSDITGSGTSYGSQYDYSSACGTGNELDYWGTPNVNLRNWNTYQILWTPDYIKAYLNGTLVVDQAYADCSGFGWDSYGSNLFFWVDGTGLAVSNYSGADRTVTDVDWIEYDSCNSGTGGC